MSSTRLYLSWALVITLALTVASYGPATIVQAVIPAVVPAANKRGGSNIFALTDTTTPAAVGTPICDNGTGVFVAGTCSPGVNNAVLQYSQKTTTNFSSVANHPIFVAGNAGVGSPTLPAGVLNTAGQILYLRAMGNVNTGSTPASNGSVELIVTFGAVTVADYTMALTGLPGSTLIPFDLWLQFTTNTTGATGTNHAIGRWNLYTAGNVTVGALTGFGIANQTSKTVDFTSSFAVGFSATLTASTNQWAWEQVTLTYL